MTQIAKKQLAIQCRHVIEHSNRMNSSCYNFKEKKAKIGFPKDFIDIFGLPR